MKVEFETVYLWNLVDKLFDAYADTESGNTSIKDGIIDLIQEVTKAETAHLNCQKNPGDGSLE